MAKYVVVVVAVAVIFTCQGSTLGVVFQNSTQCSSQDLSRLEYDFKHWKYDPNGKDLTFPAMENDIASAAANGQWDIVQKILEDSYRSKYSLTPLSQIDLRSYRVNDGEKFYGESESQFHYSSNVNGKINQRSGGHRIINDNGQVSEYDYKPSSPSYQNIQQF